MNYADIKIADVANGKVVRVSLFVSGCNHHCKGCFNAQAWDFNYGKEFTEEDIDRIINEISDEREKEIIIRRYGLYDVKEQTQKEIAADLGISRSYVSRIEKKVLEDLREKFK